MEKTEKKRRFRGLKWGLGIFAGIWLAVILIFQLVLSDRFLTGTVSRLASEYIDGEIHFGRVTASMFKSFPNLNVTIDNFSITYPHERFAAYDSLWIAHSLRDEGRSAQEDTLASFHRFSLSINYLSILYGNISLNEASLDKPRIFVHNYKDGAANWKMFRFSPDTTSTKDSALQLPHLTIHSIALTGRPRIVLSSPSDTVFAVASVKSSRFDGKLELADLWSSKIAFKIDSLQVEGRLPADTLSFKLNKFQIAEKKDAYKLETDANVFLASRLLGIIDIPISLDGKVKLLKNNFNELSIKELNAKIATLDIRGEGDLKTGADSSYLRAEVSVSDCPVQETLEKYASRLLPESLKLKTDAKISFTALCDGWYIPKNKTLPELVAEVSIPSTSIAYEGVDYSGNISADINATTDKYGRLDISLDELRADIAGMSLDATGTSVEDVLCEDPLVGLDIKASASLDTLDDFLPQGINARGRLDAALSGYMFLSDMNLYNFSGADIEGSILSDGITFTDEPDSLYAYIEKTDISLEKSGDENSLGAGLLGIKAKIDSLYASLGKTTFLRGKDLGFSLQNDVDTTDRKKRPLVGTLNAKGLAMTGEDSLLVILSGTNNSFKLSNLGTREDVKPRIEIRSDNDNIVMRQSVNRGGVKNAYFHANAEKNTARQNPRRKNYLDSLQRVYPGVPRDSLISHLLRRTARKPELPSYIADSDFKGSDLSFNIGESMSKFIREWSLSGQMGIEKGLLVTPYFPLKNNIEDVRGSFTNDQVRLSNLTLRSGESDVSMEGKVTGLRRAMLGDGIINLDLNVSSEKLDAVELLTAYSAGSKYTPPKSSIALDESLTDEQYLSEIIDTSRDSEEIPQALLVIPANVNAKLSLNGNEINYSHLMVDWFSSDIVMKERTLQITNTVATSNMGDIYLEGFYSPRSKKDISAGFDLNLVDVTADKVISLMPAVDSIMPMLKSFKGLLDCEIAATSQLDTNMNFLTPTINGVLNIKGRELSIVEDGGFRKLAKILMFKDKKVGKIDDMSVQGLINNNTLEVFPFILGVDRYVLAMSGVQNFDQSFKYHVSILKSPLPLRFGVNLSGNFDDWKYRIGKAKYKNVNVPVFTKELTDMQKNLVGSIHNIFNKGVDLVIKQNEGAVGIVDEAKASAGYRGDDESDDLDDEEKASLDGYMAEE